MERKRAEGERKEKARERREKDVRGEKEKRGLVPCGSSLPRCL